MDIRLSTAFRPFSSVLFGALLIAATGARAQGTDEERRACTPDVMRLCRQFIPSVSAITQCLIDRRPELSPECKLVMTPPKATPVRQAAGAVKKRTATPRTATPRTAAAPAAAPAATNEPANPYAALSSAATTSRTAATKKKPAAKRTAAPHTASVEPGAVIRPPMNIAPAGKPKAKKKSTLAKPAQSAAAAKPRKTTATP